MFNFKNIFGGSEYKMPETPETKIETPKQEETKGPVYQIGKTIDGRVTLRLGDGYYYSTITMSNEGVDTLIRVLEAAKDRYVQGDIEETESETEE